MALVLNCPTLPHPYTLGDILLYRPYGGYYSAAFFEYFGTKDARTLRGGIHHSIFENTECFTRLAQFTNLVKKEIPTVRFSLLEETLVVGQRFNLAFPNAKQSKAVQALVDKLPDYGTLTLQDIYLGMLTLREIQIKAVSLQYDVHLAPTKIFIFLHGVAQLTGYKNMPSQLARPYYEAETEPSHLITLFNNLEIKLGGPPIEAPHYVGEELV